MKSIWANLFVVLLVFNLASGVYGQGAESRLRPGDSVALKISGVPASEISVVAGTYDISDGGTINLPHLGPFKVTGMTPSALQVAIENAYKRAEIYTKPTIQIAPNREVGTQVVLVSGEVRAPGRVPMTANMTVHDSVTSAGGPNEFAKLKSVKLTRDGQTFTLDIRRADSKDADTRVQLGDKIHVP